MFLQFNPKLKERARRLRNHSTFGEILLWNQLKRKQILGFIFYRQKPISQYIADFYCHKLKLIIEIDGSSHIGKEDYDRTRQDNLEQLGFKFLRFQEREVQKNISGVVEEIMRFAQDTQNVSSPTTENRNSPGPSCEEGRR